MAASLAAAVLEGQGAASELHDAANLRAAVHALVDHIEVGRWSTLWAASPAAAALIAAALVSVGPDVRSIPDLPSVPPENILVVEAVLVSGLLLHRRVAQAKASGVERVGAYVWRQVQVEGRSPLFGDLRAKEIVVASESTVG